jgi:hypothetical protein
MEEVIPLMGYESPSGIVHIAGEPLLCQLPREPDWSDWIEVNGVSMRHICRNCLRMYLSNLKQFQHALVRPDSI